MRSMTNEIYEELNKKKNPVGINRTDVLQHLIDYIFSSLFPEYSTSGDIDKSFLTSCAPFDIQKKIIIEKIKSSYSVEKI